MNLPRLLSGPRRALMIRLLLNGVAQAASAFAMAWLLREAMSGLRTGAPAGTPSWQIIGGLVLAALVILGLRVREQIDAERLGQDYVMKTRLRLFQRLAAAPARTERPARFGLTMTRMITDLNGLRNWVSMGVARMAVSSVSIVGSFAAADFRGFDAETFRFLPHTRFGGAHHDHRYIPLISYDRRLAPVPALPGPGA